MRWPLIHFALFISLAGCGAASTPDASTPVDATLAEAGSDAPPADVTECLLTAPAATLPQVDGGVVIEGGDAGALPTPSGGDPMGRWLIDDATLWLPAAAQGQVDPSRSWVRGTGWATLEGGAYQISTDLGFRIEAVVGGLTRGVAMASRGRYELRGAELRLTPECASAGVAQSSLGSFRFSRDAPERARLFIEVTGMAGRLNLVFQLRRAQ